jgi:hypothetical protein
MNDRTTLERVARAICAAHQKKMYPQQDWRDAKEAVDEEWSDWLPEARAAVKAMMGSANAG